VGCPDRATRVTLADFMTRDPAPPRSETRLRDRWRWAPEAAAGCLMVVTTAMAATRAPDLYRGILGVAFLTALFFIAARDVHTRRAPNQVVYPMFVLVILSTLPLGVETTLESLLGGIAAFVVFLVIALAGRGAMGMGDVKVAAVCGAIVGLRGVIWLGTSTFIIGLLVCLPLVLLRLSRPKDTIAFTPFLAAGTAISTWLGNSHLW
jgi:prepilin signal peptidase PulO-like enzyme (type II secretory pathway)